MAAAAFMPTMAVPLQAATAAERYAQTVAQRALAAARAGSASGFASLVSRYGAVDSIAMFALGRYRRRLPRGQRQAYVRLVRRWIASLFTQYRAQLAGQSYQVTGSSAQGKSIIVRGNIVFANGSRKPVSWRLIRAGGGYKVFDVQVGGVWLANVMRSEFTTILRQSGGNFGNLFTYLRTGKKV